MQRIPKTIRQTDKSLVMVFSEILDNADKAEATRHARETIGHPRLQVHFHSVEHDETIMVAIVSDSR